MSSNENSEGYEVCMDIVETMARIFNARRLVEVRSVHISGISYQNIGDAGLEWIEELSESVKFRVKATVNPAGMDIERWKEMGITPEFYEKQMRILKALKRMGARLEMSCVPYYFERLKCGDRIAWAESNAVIYANSVIGARTNRESGITAIASAVTGLTPEYGMHLDENRTPDVAVKVELSREGDAALAGCIVGRIECDVPYLIPKVEMKESELKAIGAAMAASGGKAMFHVEGQTPEWDNYEKPEAIEVVSEEDVREMREELSPTETPDLVAIGCPHAYAGEIVRISRFVDKEKFRIPVWVFTCRRLLRNEAIRLAVEKIERAGGKVFCDTCMVVSPATEQFDYVMVDSGKALTYLPKLRGVRVCFGGLEECLRVAVSGL